MAHRGRHHGIYALGVTGNPSAQFARRCWPGCRRPGWPPGPSRAV